MVDLHASPCILTQLMRKLTNMTKAGDNVMRAIIVQNLIKGIHLLCSLCNLEKRHLKWCHFIRATNFPKLEINTLTQHNLSLLLLSYRYLKLFEWRWLIVKWLIKQSHSKQLGAKGKLNNKYYILISKLKIIAYDEENDYGSNFSWEIAKNISVIHFESNQ